MVPARIVLVSGLALALAACGGAKQPEPAAADNAQAPATTATTTAAANAAPAAFAICKSCHSVEKGKTMIGPSLFGIMGTKAGEIPGYTFSAAMKASGLTWDDATLDAFLTSPMKTVPGTRMTYAGQPDAAKRAEIIAYLKTLK
jgi:cytochrome c